MVKARIIHIFFLLIGTFSLVQAQGFRPTANYQPRRYRRMRVGPVFNLVEAARKILPQQPQQPQQSQPQQPQPQQPKQLTTQELSPRKLQQQQVAQPQNHRPNRQPYSRVRQPYYGKNYEYNNNNNNQQSYRQKQKSKLQRLKSHLRNRRPVYSAGASGYGNDPYYSNYRETKPVQPEAYKRTTPYREPKLRQDPYADSYKDYGPTGPTGPTGYKEHYGPSGSPHRNSVSHNGPSGNRYKNSGNRNDASGNGYGPSENPYGPAHDDYGPTGNRNHHPNDPYHHSQGHDHVDEKLRDFPEPEGPPDFDFNEGFEPNHFAVKYKPKRQIPPQRPEEHHQEHQIPELHEQEPTEFPERRHPFPESQESFPENRDPFPERQKPFTEAPDSFQGHLGPFPERPKAFPERPETFPESGRSFEEPRNFYRHKMREPLSAIPDSLKGYRPDMRKQAIVRHAPEKENRWTDSKYIHGHHGTFTNQVLTEFVPLQNWGDYRRGLTNIVTDNVDADIPLAHAGRRMDGEPIRDEHFRQQPMREEPDYPDFPQPNERPAEKRPWNYWK